MIKLKTLLSLAISISVALYAHFVHADEAIQKIGIKYQPAAIVNDTPITPIDIENRVAFLRIINNIPDTVTLTAKDRAKILNDLIEERIKTQEAERFNIEVSQQRIDGAYKAAARNLNLTPAQFTQKLNDKGLKPFYFDNATRHKMAWDDLLQGRYGRDLVVNTYEISQIIKATAETQGTSVTFSQIILSIDPKLDPKIAQENITKHLNEISVRLNEGARFETIASDYMQVSDQPIKRTALLAELPPELVQKLNLLQMNAISQPIKVKDSIIIIKLIDKQKGSKSLISQRMLIKSGTLDYDDLETHLEKTNFRKSLEDKSDLCEAYSDYFDDVIIYDNVTIAELPEALRPVAKSATLGEIRVVREAKKRDYVLTICKMNDIDYYNDAPKEMRKRIRNQLYNKKLQLKNKEYYNDLKNASVITVYQQ